MGPGDLSEALAPLPRRTHPDLLVGRETFDDAGVFRISADVALVQTVDFFAPVVDDPYEFGQIAAANALSDVYAMGGEPLTALNIVGFPVGRLPLSLLTSILRGGQDKVHEAGAHLVGGHTVVDEELKYGLSVTGRVHPDRILTNAGAAVGDALVLTKPLGTGILTTAAKRAPLPPDIDRAMVASMSALNAVASRVAIAVGVRCATDVTGFGLLGHASHVARASAVTIRIRVADVPLLAGADDAWRIAGGPGGADRNRRYLDPIVDWGQSTDVARALLVDPQTSGGLLVAVPPARVGEYLARVPGAVVVGEVVERDASALVLV